MADPEVDPFPSYATLTLTQAWAKPTLPIRSETGTADRSHDSRYQETAVLGEGGIGRVMLAHDARVGREVAVKVLHTDRRLGPIERARFLREAQVQGQLEHPSIVPVYDIDRRSDGTTFFTMRRVLGVTLEAILDDLRRGGPSAKARYTQRELLTALGTVCLAIDYAHSRGVIHRDLKPANIMLGDFGEVYVLDWGLARLLDESVETAGSSERLSMPGSFLGTPMYVAPEQMSSPDVTTAADVFSLGLILFEILTLERARDPRAPFVPIDARPSARAPYRDVAPELETICVRATADEPRERYPSARAMQEAIARYLEGDREVEQRRQLAARHVAAAKEAFACSETVEDGEAERTAAMRELVRALALDPGQGEHVALLAHALARPPRQNPKEVDDEIARQQQVLFRSSARHNVFGTFVWLIFLPLTFWLGLRKPYDTLWIVVPVACAAMLSLWMLRQRMIRYWMQYVALAIMVTATVGLSRLFGPLVLMPTMIVSYAITLQVHPSRAFRLITISAAMLAVAIPPLLELVGVIDTAYIFDGRWIIEPRLVALPRAGTFIFITLGNVGMVIVPALLIRQLRKKLDGAQRRQLLQAWHFQRLGADLVRASQH